MKFQKPIRWTIEHAASEFGINPRTLSGGLRRASLEPGEDSRFSTAQICSAIFGDKEAEEILKIREEREILQIKKGKLLNELLPAEAVERVWAAAVIGWRQKILGTDGLTDAQKREILIDLKTIPIDEYIEEMGSTSDPDPDEEDLPPLPEKKTT